MAKKKIKKVTKKAVNDPLLDSFVNIAVSLVSDIHSDVRASFIECGERITESKMITALTEGVMDQAEFRGASYPEHLKYDLVYKKIRKAIKAQYF